MGARFAALCVLIDMIDVADSRIVCWAADMSCILSGLERQAGCSEECLGRARIRVQAARTATAKSKDLKLQNHLSATPVLCGFYSEKQPPMPFLISKVGIKLLKFFKPFLPFIKEYVTAISCQSSFNFYLLD